MLASHFSSRALRLTTAAAALMISLAACAPSDAPVPSTTAGLPNPAAAPTTSAPPAAQPTDYRRLLLNADDVSDAEDTFHERSRDAQPNGQDGASAFFVNDQDTRAISATVLVYPDAAAATATLKQAAATLPTLVAGGTPAPLAVGTDGVVVSGEYPNEAKAVTLVFFTQGDALVRLEFQSATGDATTPQFVTNVAKMQQIALRVGLPNGQ